MSTSMNDSVSGVTSELNSDINEPVDDKEKGEEIDLNNLKPHEIFDLVSTGLSADIFLYSGELIRDGADSFIELVESSRSNDNVVLILATPGGDADAAYIIARYLKRTYRKFILCVFGYCKSAGTLLALGADEIIMSCRGEFGPLDVQIPQADEIGLYSSGLDIVQALQSLSERAFQIWEEQFIGIKSKSLGVVTTKTAGEIASSLTVGLLSPITTQIDPLKMGEMYRAVKIAYQYGIRLSGDASKVRRLINSYPSHSFVIDYKEAEEIFGNVREPKPIETLMELILLKIFMEENGYDCIRLPSPKGIIAYLNSDEQDDEQPEEKYSEGRGDDNADKQREEKSDSKESEELRENHRDGSDNSDENIEKESE